MSNVIDERVVEMRFDNKDFESNVKTSLSTLDRLKQALKFSDSSKSLDNIAAATKRVDFSGMSNGIQTVQARFSALEVVAMTALSNITNSAINAGRQLVSAFTIEPVHDGFSEYELKMGSVQTIMASTGASLEEVNGYLQELNLYADKTIYSFSDMTASIGKFTNAGVDLDQAVAAIKGISNEAALSGANANEASRAMYNFAQALSSGAVKLIDWKSIENANMATKEFKQELIDTAVEMGTVEKSADGMYKSITGAGNGGKDPFNATKAFNDSLSSQWMTTDVLIKTLNRYADETTNVGKRATAAAQDVKTFTQLMDTLKEAAGSGWAQTWELMVGDFDEAKEHFTKLSQIFGGAIDNMSDARNNLLEGAMRSNWSRFTEEMNGMGISVEQLDTKVREFARNNMSAQEYAKSAFSDTNISLKELVEDGTVSTHLLGDALYSIADAATNIKNIDIGTQFGSESEGVKELQQALIDAGFALEEFGVDGKFYGETQEALKKFQEANGLEATGIVDQQTLDMLQQEKIELGDLSDLLTDLGKKGGQELLWESLFNSIEAVGKVLGTVKDAWDSVFSPITSAQLYSVIEGIHSFTESLIPTEEQMEKMQKTFKGVFSVLDIFGQSLKGIGNIGIATIKNVLSRFNFDILGTTANVGDLLVKFHDWVEQNKFIEKGVTEANKAINAGIDRIGKWIESFKNLPTIKQNIENFKMAFKDFNLGEFGEHLKATGQRLGEFIAQVKNTKDWNMETVKQTLKDFKTNVIDYFFSFKGFDKFKAAFKSLGADIKSALSKVGIDVDAAKAKITEFFDKLKNGKVNFDPKQVFASIVDGVKGFISDIKTYLSQVDGPLGFVRDKFAEFGKTVSGIIEDIPWGRLIAVAGSLGAIFALFKIGSWIKDILTPIQQFKEILQDFTESISDSFAKFATAKEMEALSKSVLILAAAMAVIASIPEDRFGVAVGVVAGLVIAISALMVTLSILSKKGADVTGVAKQLIGLSVALGVLTAAIVLLSIIPFNNIVQGVAIVTIGMIGLLAAMYGLTKINASIPKKAAITFIGLGVALTALAVAIRLIGGMKPEAAVAGIAAVTVIMIGLVHLMKQMSQIQGSPGKGMLQAVSSLLLVVVALKLLTTIKPSEILQSIVGMITIFGMLFVLMKMSKNASNGGSSLLAMSASLLILVAAVKMLGSMDPAVAVRGIAFLGAMVILVGMLALINKLVNKVNSTGVAKGNIASMIAMAGSLLILSAALALLGQIDSGRLVAATACLTVIMIAMGFLVKALEGVMNASATAKGTIATIVILTSAIAALGIVIAVLSAIPFANLLGASVALTIGIAAFTIALKTIGNMQSVSASAIVAIAGMTAVAVALTAMIGYLAGLGGADVLASATALSETIGAITAAAWAASVIGQVPIGAIAQGTLVLGALAGLVTGIIGAVGWINQLTDGGLAEKFQSAVPVLMAIGEAFGAIISGFGVGLSDGLPAIGKNLEEFGTSLSGFFATMEGVDGGVFEGVSTITGVITALAADSFLSGLANLLPKSNMFGEAKTLTEKLMEFGEAVKAYGDSVGDMDDSVIEKITKTMEAIRIIVEAANKLDNTGGALQKLTGFKDIGAFGDQLGQFVEGFSTFISNSAVSEFDESKADTISRLMESVKKIISATEGLDLSGGFLQDLIGSKDLGAFTDGLGEFATNMLTFLNTPGLDAFSDDTAITKIDNVMKAAGKLVSLSNDYNPEGNKLTNWISNSGLDNFSNDLKPFAEGISDFSASIKDVSDDDISKMTSTITAASEIITAMNSVDLKDSGGIFSGNSMEQFAQGLKPLGEGVSNYSKALEEFDDSAVGKTNSISTMLTDIATAFSGGAFEKSDIGTFGIQLQGFAQSVVDFGKKISKVGDVDLSSIMNIGEKLGEMITKMGDISTFSSSLDTIATTTVESLAKSFTSNSNPLVEAGVSMIDKVIEGMTKQQGALTESFNSMMSQISAGNGEAEGVEGGTELMSGTATGIAANAGAVTDAIGGVMSGGLTAISSKLGSFTSSGSDLMSSLVQGISSRAGGVSDTFSSAVSNAQSAISGYDFTSIGSNLVQGLINGLDAKLGEVQAKAAEIGRVANEALKTSTQQASPSRLWKKYGQFMDQGLINGLAALRDKVGSTAYSIGETANTGLQNAVEMVANSIGFGEDYQPVISPVLDLSNVEAGAGRISGMFGLQTVGVGVMANISAINQNMAASRRDPNSEVVSMLAGLREDFANKSGGNTYVINGMTYDDGSNIARTIGELYRAARIESRA